MNKKNKDNFKPSVVHMACMDRKTYSDLLKFCTDYRLLNGNVLSVEHVEDFDENKYEELRDH